MKPQKPYTHTYVQTHTHIHTYIHTYIQQVDSLKQKLPFLDESTQSVHTFIHTYIQQVDSLKQKLPFLDEATQSVPALDAILAQIAPLVLVILTALVPAILRQYAKLEGHVNNRTLNGSLFTKLAAFQLIQVCMCVCIFVCVYVCLVLFCVVCGFTKLAAFQLIQVCMCVRVFIFSLCASLCL